MEIPLELNVQDEFPDEALSDTEKWERNIIFMMRMNLLWIALFNIENHIQIETLPWIVELDFLCDRWSVSFCQFRSWKRAWSDRSISKTWIFMNLTFDIFDFWSINLLSYWSSSQKINLTNTDKYFSCFTICRIFEKWKLCLNDFPQVGYYYKLLLHCTSVTALTMPRLRMDKIIVWVDFKQICVEFEAFRLNDYRTSIFDSWMLSEFLCLSTANGLKVLVKLEPKCSRSEYRLYYSILFLIHFELGLLTITCFNGRWSVE